MKKAFILAIVIHVAALLLIQVTASTNNDKSAPLLVSLTVQNKETGSAEATQEKAGEVANKKDKATSPNRLYKPTKKNNEKNKNETAAETTESVIGAGSDQKATRTIDATRSIADLADDLYVESWTQKLIRIGEARYPKNLQGRVKIATTIKGDGSLKEVKVLYGSNTALNMAAVDLIQFAAPYSKHKEDELTIIRWFNFEL